MYLSTMKLLVPFCITQYKLFLSVEGTFCWIQFFLLNLLCLHLTFIYVDLLHFFIYHAVQFLDARRTKVCPLFAVNLFFKIQYCLLWGFFCLLVRDTVILFTKHVHSFSCQKKKKKPTSPNSAPPQSPLQLQWVLWLTL